MTNKEIATDLCLSPFTVAQHLRRVYLKLDVKSRSRAPSVARELGLV
jgi:DNA-binding CsgD family transcriptional regulator